MKKQVMIILFLLIAYLLIGITIAPLINEEDYVPNELIIKYKENLIIEDINAVKEFAIFKGINKPEQVEKLINGKELYNLKFGSNVDISGVVKKYSESEDIEYAEPNYIFRTSITPNDANYSLQWALSNINAEKAWNLTTGSSSVVIAIIDTGIDWDHPDLAINIWNNTDEDCTDGTDEDGNGYVDDCRGYDFVNVSSGCSDDDCDIEDNNPADTFGHGTHVAGIAGAVSNNGEGVAGICWNCSLMAVRAGYKDSSGQGSLSTADIVQALNYATINNATIISMSFGGSDSATIRDAINNSYANGLILVASAGNDGTNSKKYPCAYNNVICVAATDNDNTSASYSNYGDWINLSAPGTGIWSTYYDDTYSSLSGTSMSTPLVVGAIGLIKSLFSNLTQIQIENTLNNTGVVVDFNGYNISKINIYSAILSLDNIPPLVNLTSPVDNHVNLTVNQTFSCNTTDWQLDNVTLQIWNSSDLYYNETMDVSSASSNYEFNVSNIDYNDYKWNCLAYDEKNNFAYAGSNFSLTIGNITIALVSPPNNTNTNTGFNMFNCSAQTESTKELTNITFYLWNSTGLVYNLTENISGTSNSSLFNHTFAFEDMYKWNCHAYNNESLNTIHRVNSTIIYDVTAPLINLNNPSESESYSSALQSINFAFNITDNFDVLNCSLIINGIVNQTNASVDKSITQNFSGIFAQGIYDWNVNCSDNAGNTGNSTLRRFTITAPSPPATTASSGGGGGSISSIGKTYMISAEQASFGYTKELAKNDKIKFTFFNKEFEQHTLIIDEIGKDYIKITIQSNPIILKLGVGQSAKLNLTTSKYYDLFVKLNSIKDNKANIIIQTINEEIPKTSEPTITGQEVLEDITKSEESMELLNSELNKLRKIVYSFVVIIILIIIYLLLRERKYIRKRIRKFHIEEHKDKFNKHIKPRKRG